ncbi:cytochrome d ubiquinol oxidase subunit II, partial [Xanthomonas citri pv. citri]|nr:cytochrome d ubiquinol oxidase subunit II [Xanthomonas citri pv. citri]
MAEVLPVYWYVIIAVLWLGYLALDGFDLGVGMLVRFWARDEPRRRVLLNIIGPVWEGNEVWLITAVGAMFAAFP